MAEINGENAFTQLTKLNVIDKLLVKGNEITGIALNQLQIIYVAKAGSDTNSGLNVNTPKLTINEAITTASALTPSISNQIVIEIIDGSTYQEDFTIPSFVHLFGMQASVDGNTKIEDTVVVKLRAASNSTSSSPVFKKVSGTGEASITVDALVVVGSSQEGIVCDAGRILLNAGIITVDAGFAIKAKNGSAVAFNVAELVLSNSARGIGTQSAGGGANTFYGNVLTVTDDGTCTMIKTRVDGDTISVQGGSFMVDELFDLGTNSTLNAFSNESTGTRNADPTATVNITINGISNFNPQTGIAIDRLIEGISLAASQEPTGLGIANAMNIEFGAAIGTGSDPAQLDVNGQVTFNEAGLYRIKVVFQFGRTGQSGNSEILFRFLIDGVQLGRTVGAKLGGADELRYIDIDNWFNVPAGTTLNTQVMRDNSGDNSGGVFQTLPTDEGAGTWNAVPSAVMRVERWILTP